ncbi:MAG: T9SS type B sorting domain-containing protein [Bacteroidales bacterium]|nr:T9SS type B sorting domain-containing protein [Bacteroidales bacterium]
MIRTRKDSVGHSYVHGGFYPVKLYAFYDDGCVDSITRNIRVYKPKSMFNIDKTEGCAPLPVVITDVSVPDVHPINFWSWDFGDGYDSTYNTKTNTLNKVFGFPGVYTTTLMVSDDFGCSATFEKKISTAVPQASFSAVSNTQICVGNEVSFMIDYPNPDSAVWDFGNGKLIRSVAIPTKHMYSDTGSFDVSLTIYKYGCSDNYTYNKYVQVQKADARFTASDTVYNCYPRKITLSHTSGNNSVETGQWFYGHNNNSSQEYTPTTSYNYTEPGIFKAKLRIETGFGCSDTFSRTIKISGPKGQFEVTPKLACKGDEITFTLTDTSNVYSFEWDLGDGNFSKANPVKHHYTSVGDKAAKLILSGDNGKCIAPAIEQTISIYQVVAGINMSDTSACEGTAFEFKNSSIGANSYQWDFGNGSTSTMESPQQILPKGLYKVALSVGSAEGCRDTAIQYVVVNAVPLLSISNDTTICTGDTAILKAFSNHSINWLPVDDLSSANNGITKAGPKQSLYYTAYATDALSGCYKKDSIYVTVQQVPEIDLNIESTSVIAGRPVQLIANTEDNAIFEWIPADFLSCSNCFNPVSTARVTTNYLLKVTDKNNCFTVEHPFVINVEEGEKSFDVPTAFTPGGGEANSIFKVQGYNVKQLLEFKIYNRWGNLVFSGTDLSQGWDGTYQGKAQPIDSYVYTIKVETFDGKIETKTGTLLLLR